MMLKKEIELKEEDFGKEKKRQQFRDWKKRNRGKINEYYNRIYHEIRDKILLLLGNKCISCGNSDKRVLQIDHVNGGGNAAHKQESNARRFYKRILKEIEQGSKDYQLLCANCNWIKKCERGEL